MVEEVETSKVLEELSRGNAAASSGESKRKGRGGIGWFFVLFLFVPLLAAAALLGYQQWTLYLRINSLATANNLLLESLRTSNDRLEVLETANSESEQNPLSGVDQSVVEQLRQEFNSNLQQLDLVIAELRERAIESPIQDDSNLQLVEAEHLLRIANRHLQLTDDIATTTSLLESADRMLLDSADSRTVAVRESIARELTQLRTIEEVDIEGIYLRLTALRDLIAGLDIAPSIGSTYQQQLAQSREQASEVPDAEQPANLWQSGLDFFSTIFVWREWEETPEILEPNREILYTRQNIELMLEQAQLALLTRRPSVYRQSLQGALDLIAQYSAVSDQTAAQVVSQLESLLQQELAPELPDISQSLMLLRQINSQQSLGSSPVVQ